MSGRRISLAFIFLALVGAVSISLLVVNSSKPEKTTQPAGGNTANTILITVAVFSVVSIFLLMLWRMFGGKKGMGRREEGVFSEFGRVGEGFHPADVVQLMYHYASRTTKPEETRELFESFLRNRRDELGEYAHSVQGIIDDNLITRNDESRKRQRTD